MLIYTKGFTPGLYPVEISIGFGKNKLLIGGGE